MDHAMRRILACGQLIGHAGLQRDERALLLRQRCLAWSRCRPAQEIPMPEQLTKHPEVTIQVLKGAGARCGADVPKKILTKCPSERFCSFASGEMCVYGLDQLPQMTQITRQDLSRLVCPTAGGQGGLTGLEGVGVATPLVLGLVLGAVAGRWSRR
jgi:hypothetical protein